MVTRPSRTPIHTCRLEIRGSAITIWESVVSRPMKDPSALISNCRPAKVPEVNLIVPGLIDAVSTSELMAIVRERSTVIARSGELTAACGAGSGVLFRADEGEYGADLGV